MCCPIHGIYLWVCMYVCMYAFMALVQHYVVHVYMYLPVCMYLKLIAFELAAKFSRRRENSVQPTFVQREKRNFQTAQNGVFPSIAIFAGQLRRNQLYMYLPVCMYVCHLRNIHYNKHTYEYACMYLYICVYVLELHVCTLGMLMCRHKHFV